MTTETAEKEEGTVTEPEVSAEPVGKEDAKSPEPGSLEYWKKKSRDNENRAKANADAAKRLKDLEDASKSDADKLNDRVANAEKRAGVAEAKALRLEVAAAKGLNPKQAQRLQGETLQELEDDADDLLASFKSPDTKSSTSPNSTRRPQERLRGGTEPDEEVAEEDPAKLADQIIGRRGF